AEVPANSRYWANRSTRTRIVVQRQASAGAPGEQARAPPSVPRRWPRGPTATGSSGTRRSRSNHKTNGAPRPDNAGDAALLRSTPPPVRAGAEGQTLTVWRRETWRRRSLDGLKIGTARAGTSTRSPVRGFRATRDFRLRTLKVPKPRISMF